MPSEANYLDFWELRQPPFELQADPQFFYRSKTHEEALARMGYFISDKGMGVAALTGEIGSGKTLVLRILQKKIARDCYQIVYLPTANYEFIDLMQEINHQLFAQENKGGGVNKYQILKSFEEFLKSRISGLGKHLLIILDEAQMLSNESIEELKCLTNLNQNGQVLSILFAGQPELKDKLKKLPQVYQRVGMYYHLGTLSRAETPEYIKYRLESAGAKNPNLFAEECMDLIYEFSSGCPRQINRLCKLAVDRACLLKKEKMDRKTVDMIVKDINRQFGDSL